MKRLIASATAGFQFRRGMHTIKKNKKKKNEIVYRKYRTQGVQGTIFFHIRILEGMKTSNFVHNGGALLMHSGTSRVRTVEELRAMETLGGSWTRFLRFFFFLVLSALQENWDESRMSETFHSEYSRFGNCLNGTLTCRRAYFSSARVLENHVILYTIDRSYFTIVKTRSKGTTSASTDDATKKKQKKN